jgi:predicted DNA-binding transcriptional regulator AlpA
MNRYDTMNNADKNSTDGEFKVQGAASKSELKVHKPARRAAARAIFRSKYPEMAFLKVEEVEGMLSCTRNLLYALEKKGQFPNRIRISHQCVRYRMSDIQNWIAKQQDWADALAASVVEDGGQTNE